MPPFCNACGQHHERNSSCTSRPLTKAEASREIQERDAPSLAKAVDAVNKAIRERWDGQSIVFIAVPDGMTAVARHNLQQQFNDAGWRIDFKSDQRDGCYIELS